MSHGKGERQAQFTSMDVGTQEDWTIIADAAKGFNKGLAGRVIEHLKLLDGDFGGFAIDRLSHSVQTATRAWKDGRNEEYTVCALLHDIGKVWHEEPELPHALLGMELAQKYKEHPEVCNAIGAHHDEIEMKYLLSPVVQVCDAISGARPGARRQVLDSYIQRLKDLEQIAFNFKGVQKAYAIQAGRELRVIVESEKVDDNNASRLSFEISQGVRSNSRTLKTR